MKFLANSHLHSSQILLRSYFLCHHFHSSHFYWPRIINKKISCKFEETKITQIKFLLNLPPNHFQSFFRQDFHHLLHFYQPNVETNNSNHKFEETLITQKKFLSNSPHLFPQFPSIQFFHRRF